jgi:hypothetical protein
LLAVETFRQLVASRRFRRRRRRRRVRIIGPRASKSHNSKTVVINRCCDYSLTENHLEKMMRIRQNGRPPAPGLPMDSIFGCNCSLITVVIIRQKARLLLHCLLIDYIGQHR